MSANPIFRAAKFPLRTGRRRPGHWPLVLSAAVVATLALPGVPPVAAQQDSGQTEGAPGDTATPNVANPKGANPKGANQEGATGKTVARAVVLPIRGVLSEGAAPGGLFGELMPSVRQTIERLDRAAKDDEVAAVVLRIRSPVLGRAKLAEMRRAIRRLRAAGKTVWADLQFAMPADYLLACGCDEIILPESGMLLVPGVRAEVTFYKGLLDKLGLQAEMLQVGPFKGAAEPMTRTAMSDAFRQQYELVVDDLFDQMVDTIALERGLQRERVRQLIDQGLFTPQQALDSKLIDRVAYADQYHQALQESLHADALELVAGYGRKRIDTDFSGVMGMMKFMELLTGGRAKQGATGGKKIAVVNAVGTIVPGRSQTDLFGGSSVGSHTIVAALKQAEQDEAVAAVVLRIDSPGGSALASDLIWRQVSQMEKPIVASMGDMAASGGYYIAMGCDCIYADAGTLTGSIGVVGGKIATRGLYEKLGITTQVIGRGRNSGMFSSGEPFSETERAAFTASMQETYRQFTTKAAQGRNMDLAKLQRLAGGRLWTGRQAQARGLVDQIGGLDDAVRKAATLAGLDGATSPALLVLPPARSFFQQLLETPEAELRVMRLLEPQTRSLGPHLQASLRRAGSVAVEIQQLFREPVLLWLPYDVRIY